MSGTRALSAVLSAAMVSITSVLCVGMAASSWLIALALSPFAVITALLTAFAVWVGLWKDDLWL